MVSLLQISDGHHHGDTTELRASSQTSSSVVASSLKPSTLQPFSLPYCQRTDFHSFQSHPPMPLNCPHSASFFFFFCIGCGVFCTGFSFCAFLLHALIAQLGHHFIYHFNSTHLILASLYTFSCLYFRLTNSLGSNLEPVKFRFKFCLLFPL